MFDTKKNYTKKNNNLNIEIPEKNIKNVLFYSCKIDRKYETDNLIS